MGGKKRQETTSLRSSSGRLDSMKTAAATVDVGCMSGIFQFISKYHTRRKFLTFRKRQEKHAQSSPPQPPPPIPEPLTCPSRDEHEPTTRPSFESPRSPSLPPQLRRSSSSLSPPPPSPPSVVARLMGVNEVPPPYTVEAAAEKRRKLLGALEKCDEDLKALKRVIEAARVKQTPPPVVERKKPRQVNDDDDEPSPVSVLDRHDQYDYECQPFITRSPPLASYSNRIINGQTLQHHQMNNKHQMMKKLKPGQGDHNVSFLFPNRRSPSFTMIPPQQTLYLPTRRRPMFDIATSTSSVAMKESVSDVCKDVAQGQRREVGRMVLLLQDFIYGDLIDEIIRDLKGTSQFKGFKYPITLPFEACKRQLCF